MYVADDQASGSVGVPESRTDFYKKVTEELLIKRRQQQLSGSTIAPTTLREQRERILGRIALEHLLDVDQPANLLSWSHATAVIKDILRCDDSKAELEFRALARETGLVSEERPRESFRFIHLTFCEFLAAYEVIQVGNGGWEKLISAHQRFQDEAEPQRKSRLLEVIPFEAYPIVKTKKSDN
jgi:hypothetical protein